MRDFIKDLEKEFGKDILEKRDGLNVIKTGSLALDLSIGVGGIPKSKFSEIYGPESSGKTTLGFSLCKSSITDGGNVLYIDSENALDFDYMQEVIDIDFDKVDSTVMTNKENGANILTVQPETGENALNILESGLISGEFNLIILDSVGALAPKREMEKDLEKATVAETPRLLSKFFRRSAYFVRRNDVAVVFLNQVRDKVGSYVGGYESPGGHAIKHYCAVRIQLGKGQAIKQEGESVGVLTPFTVKKNKVAPPFRASTFPIIYGKGIDSVRDTVEFAKFLGVIKLRGSHYIFNDEHIAQGMNNVVATLTNDTDTLDKIVEVCYNSVIGKNKGKEQENETK
jgi:recombination protein RecA